WQAETSGMTERRPMARRRRPGIGIALGLAALSAPALATAFATAQSGDPELDGYLKGTPDDTVTRLQKGIDDGRVTLRYDGDRGYLPAVLRALSISPSSQMLVFSKTSFQRDLISPRNPRALYFNDDVYVGWVPGGEVVEISTADPGLGGVFYT